MPPNEALVVDPCFISLQIKEDVQNRVIVGTLEFRTEDSRFESIVRTSVAEADADNIVFRIDSI